MDAVRKLFGPFVGGPGGIALLLIRLVMGLAFIYHGYPKIQNATGWMGPTGPPAFLQALAALAEFGGGAALLLGLLTPLASLGIIFTMLGALFLALLPNGAPFVASKPGSPSYELALLYLVLGIGFLTLGPGAFSLDALLFKKARPTEAR